ncbi:hypothetical protein [Streptomyces sp. NPDC058953]|uniref:hypothetical protein n=1 Tax=unclassified Streptomyces TaxID=2593676 RepID=UPI00367F7AA1
MPQEYAEGRTTDPETWTTSPERLAALAKLTATTEARSRALADGELAGPAAEPAVGPRRQGHGHEQQSGHGHGQNQGRGGVQP